MFAESTWYAAETVMQYLLLRYFLTTKLALVLTLQDIHNA